MNLQALQATLRQFAAERDWQQFHTPKNLAMARELYGVMAARGAAGGFVVTSGRFTDDAIDFAQGRNVLLIDGPELHALIRQATSSTEHALKPSAQHDATDTSAKAGARTAEPTCPSCGKSMVRRTAKRGAHAGSEFWGCVGYPTCRGSRSTGLAGSAAGR